MAQMRLKNVSGKEIRQLFEGKTYVWGPGEAMTLPGTIAGWMLRKANDPDRNPEAKVPRKGGGFTFRPFLEQVEIPASEAADDALAVVRADVKAKPAETPEAPPTPAPAATPAAATK